MRDEGRKKGRKEEKRERERYVWRGESERSSGNGDRHAIVRWTARARK